jgi:uroporphyrin-III C-methyltransferase
LEAADVVVHDALVSPAVLDMVNPQAELINAGKRRGVHSLLQAETTQLLIDKARSGKIVVRLKGGDPFVFGRGGEEMEDICRVGLSVEVVPGVTSGVAAPAYAQIPLTHRDYSSSVTFVTGHESAGKYRPEINWEAIAQGSETIVVYMGLHNLSYIIGQLQLGGLNSSTPIALIRWGTRPEQEELMGTLENIMDLVAVNEFQAPMVAVIGAVVKLSEQLRHNSNQPQRKL